jgi:hypothetical protein
MKQAVDVFGWELTLGLRRGGLAALLLAIVGNVASADVVVDDESMINARPVASNVPALANVWTSMAQSFTAPYTTVSFGFRLKDNAIPPVNPTPNAGKPIIYRLYQGEITPLTLLATRTVHFPDSLLNTVFGDPRRGDAGFVDADFSEVSLVIGQKYSIEITLPADDLPDVGEASGIGVWTSLTDVYPEGRFFFPLTSSNPVSSNNSFFASNDMSFRIIDISTEESVEALLEELQAEVVGVGPGKSLVDKLDIAQAYYAVPDLVAACAMMDDFVAQISALLRGRRLDTQLSSELISDAGSVKSAMGCD